MHATCPTHLTFLPFITIHRNGRKTENRKEDNTYFSSLNFCCVLIRKAEDDEKITRNKDENTEYKGKRTKYRIMKGEVMD
jgi:predicted metal-binding transcription factor (methanogenesis marker protein 9)